MGNVYDVNYKEIKTAISNAAHATSRIRFAIDYDTLNESVKESGLTLVPISLSSRRVEEVDIIGLSEYFWGSRLSWFDDTKEFTELLFVSTDAIDDTVTGLMNELAKDPSDNPDFDRVEAVAKITAEYPCYFATVVSYKSNDPARQDKLCLTMVCRANKVIIKSSNYQYKAEDMA